ncbi:unnamed protein product, partial [Iphiclides podalirius]
MSIIAVCGLPIGWDLKTIVKKLLKTINGKFEALSIICNKKSRKCYLRLSERLDPQLVVENINRKLFDGNKLHALVPESVPDLPHHIRPRKIPLKMRRAMRIPEESTPGEVIYTAHMEILNEMQSKYTELGSLSKTTNHLLLRNIARIILDRLKDVLLASPEADNGFKLTKFYRKMHPHFGDFQLILSTLHQIEDSEGKPRTQLNKQEFAVTNVQPYVIDNIPFNKVSEICRKYSKIIATKMTEHTKNLNTNIEAEPGSEEEATKRVRAELKKMSLYFPVIIKQVISTNFVPQKTAFYRIRVYGEPFLPPKEVMLDFLKRCNATKVFRSDRIFNMLRCKVPLASLQATAKADGSVVGGATLYIRLAEIQFYKVPESMKREMFSFQDGDEQAADAVDMEDTKEWDEEW